MQRRFPLLDLPDWPFENVYGYLEFEDLIQLASCSNRLKSLIQTMEQRQKKLTNFWFGNPQCEGMNIIRDLILYDESQGQTRKEFYISFCTDTHARFPFFSEHRKFIGGEVPYVYDRENGIWLAQESTEHQLFLFEYLKDLFNCRVEIRLRVDHKRLTFKTLLLNTDLLHVADIIKIHFNQASAESLTYLMNTLQARKLEITFQDTPNLKLGELVVKSRCLTMRSAPFLNLEDVWKIIQGGICRQLNFGDIEVRCTRDINQFVKNWLNSDNTTFEALEFDEFEIDTRAPDELLGIPNFPGCKKRANAAEYYNKHTQYENGRDIRRKDGLLATFLEKSTGQTSKRFSFTVWYCFDPNVLEDDKN